MPTQAQKTAWYGKPMSNLIRWQTPWTRIGSDGKPKPIAVYIRKEILPVFAAACTEAKATCAWTPLRIDSAVDRPVRGQTVKSQHAYGLAFDFFDKPFPQPVDIWGSKNAPGVKFRAVFKRHGFTAGADWKTRQDFPHIEWRGQLPS